MVFVSKNNKGDDNKYLGATGLRQLCRAGRCTDSTVRVFFYWRAACWIGGGRRETAVVPVRTRPSSPFLLTTRATGNK
jgi:hypothetical protein